MKAKALVSCLVTSSWLLACGSEPPPDDSSDPSDPEDDVVVIATAEAVTSSAAASNAAGGAAATAGSAAASSGGAGDRTASTAGESSTGSSAAGGAGSTSDGAATDASTTGEPAGGAAGAAASGGAANGSGAAAGSDAGQQTAGTPVTAAASGGAGGSDGGGFGGEPSTTGEPPPPVPLGAVLITEYVEGVDGDDKAVELSNLSDETVVLSECRLETYFNGNLESSSGVDLTTIELRPQTSYVLCKSSASTGLSSACHRAAASINFNGDDALVLRCNGVIHDSFGQVGFDPGDEWRSSESSSGTADHVLRRRCGAAARTESSSPFEAVLGEDWISVWTFDEGTSAEYPGLGIAACAEPDAAVDAGGSDAGTGGAASE